MEFRDFYELAAKVSEYEELLREEIQRRKATMGSYYQEVETSDITVAQLYSLKTYVCPMLVRKNPYIWKKAHASNVQTQYTFEVAKTKEIFDFLLKEKCITIPVDHIFPTKEEMKGKDYYKYNNS